MKKKIYKCAVFGENASHDIKIFLNKILVQNIAHIDSVMPKSGKNR